MNLNLSLYMTGLQCLAAASGSNISCSLQAKISLQAASAPQATSEGGLLLNSISVNSPLEQFEVTNLLSIQFPVLGYITLTLTNMALYSIIVLSIVLGFHYLSNNESKLIPSKWSIFVESIYTTILSIVRDQIGVNRENYFPFIYSLFFFILIANLIGNIPYNYTVTTSIIVSIGLSVTIFIGVTILGIIIKRLSFLATFVPNGTPLELVPLLTCIEFVSYCARAFSLGIRLFANLVAGHSLLKILSTFLLKFFNNGLFSSLIALVPFSIFVALSVLEIAVSIIQSYVFIVLTSSYIRDSYESH